MTEIVREFGSQAMLEAIDANFAEEMMCFGRALPGGIVREGPELWWFYTGRPRLNGVTLTHITPTTPATHPDAKTIHEKITEALAFFGARGVPTHWAVTATTQPADLARYLLERGFTQVDQDSTMAADLHTLNLDMPLPPSVHIEEIRDAELLQKQRDISMVCFNATPELAQTYYECYVENGFGAEKLWHHYLAWLDGDPIGIASLLLHAGIAGIYGVGTLPHGRGRGIGTALTLHALKEARAHGYAIATLSPSQMGLSLYRKIGFHDVSNMTFYLRQLQQLRQQ